VFRRGCLIGQINSVLCYFGKLDSYAKVRLLKCFCYSLYGCELWDLDSANSLDGLCAAWRKGMRRALGLPFSAHSFLFPSLSCTLPLYEEICKRSACFLNKCIFSSSCLVRSVTLSSINFGRYDSVIYRNLCTVCKLFNWSVHDYISGRVCLRRRFFTAYYKSRLPDDKSTTVSFMYELLKLRDGYLDFSGVFRLDQSGIATLTDFVANA